MHPTHPALYAIRLSLNHVRHINALASSSAFYKTKSFDRSTTTFAVCLATIGLSLSMFSLKQMQSSHQRRLRRC